jgi:hypothetical protein
MWWWSLFWLGAIRITQVWLQCLKDVSDVTELRRSDFPPQPPFFFLERNFIDRERLSREMHSGVLNPYAPQALEPYIYVRLPP